MSNKFNALVFIGRFSPFHLGHQAVVDQALNQAKEVIILVGSAFNARNMRTPFTYEERKRMIKAVYPQENVIVKPLMDYPYDDNKWIAAVQSIVYASIKHTNDPIKIGLIGHNKDSSSYYLKIFPGWNSVNVEDYKGFNATDYRNAMYDRHTKWINTDISNNYYHQEKYNLLSKTMIDSKVKEVLRNEYYNNSFEWTNFFDEVSIINKQREAWKDAPYPPTFITVDAVVVQSGHVLLVKRKASPGKGLWALPGGFLDQNETVQDGALRELKEETKIKVPMAVLKGSIKDSKVFDDPYRSDRGRTVTHAFYIDLGYKTKLEKVTGADDAEKAVWVPFKDIDRQTMFEDHYHIIDYFTNLG